MIISGAQNPNDMENTVAEDIRLVRSALLYADKVRLVSATAAALTGLSAFGSQRPINQMLHFMALMPDDFLAEHMDRDPADARRAMEAMSSITMRSRRERRLNSKVRTTDQIISDSVPPETGVAVQQHAKKLWALYGGPELDVALEHGVLEIDQEWFFDTTTNDIDQTKILEKLRNPDAHLLVDFQIRKLAEAAVREGHLEMPRTQASRLRKTKTGTTMLTHLPTFEDAPVEKILTARTETQDYLGRYRTTVAQLAEKLHAEPFSSEISSEIDDLWHDSVLPQVLEIQEALAESSLGSALKNSVRNLPAASPKIVGAGLVASPFIHLGVSTLTDLVAIIPTLATSSILAAGEALRNMQKDFDSAYRATRDNKQHAKRDGLFYLYSVNQALS